MVFCQFLHAATITDVENAVMQINEYENSYDLKVFDFYSDDAVLETAVVDSEEIRSLSGAQYKQMGARSFEASKINQDSFVIKDIYVVEESENRFVATMQRTVVQKCFTAEHKMVFEERQASLLLVEELGTMSKFSRCEPEKEVKKALKKFRRKLPHSQMIDDETFFTGGVVDGENLSLNYMLVNLNEPDVDTEKLNGILAQSAYTAACTDPTLRTFLDMGVTIRFKYSYKDFSLASEYIIRAGSCHLVGFK